MFHGLAASVHRETLERLRELPGVTGVWADQRISAMLANSVPLIRADQVWDQLGYRGAGVTVAVLDTGRTTPVWTSPLSTSRPHRSRPFPSMAAERRELEDGS